MLLSYFRQNFISVSLPSTLRYYFLCSNCFGFFGSEYKAFRKSLILSHSLSSLTPSLSLLQFSLSTISPFSPRSLSRLSLCPQMSYGFFAFASNDKCLRVSRVFGCESVGDIRMCVAIGIEYNTTKSDRKQQIQRTKGRFNTD